MAAVDDDEDAEDPALLKRDARALTEELPPALKAAKLGEGSLALDIGIRSGVVLTAHSRERERELLKCLFNFLHPLEWNHGHICNDEVVERCPVWTNCRSSRFRAGVGNPSE